MKKKVDKLNDFTVGQIMESCLMVSKGCKPCSLRAILKKHVNEAVNLVEDSGCLALIAEHVPEWVELWIYKNPQLKEIILSLPKEPVTKADSYLLGALFGYSNEEICNYLEKI